jgi:integrase
MRIAVNGLQLRNRTYHFRRAVPPDLIEAVGKREWRKSLELRDNQQVAAAAQADALWRTTDTLIEQLRRRSSESKTPLELHTEAARWAADLGLLDGQSGRQSHTELHDGRVYEFDSEADLTIDHIIEQAGREHGLNELGNPLRISPSQRARLVTLQTGMPIKPGLLISDAVKIYVHERWGEAEDKATLVSTQQFITMMGDLDLLKIKRPVVISWLQRLVTERGQSAGTVTRRLAVMKAVFNHLIKNHDYEVSNPFSDQTVPRNATSPVRRVPFHHRHWQLIDRHLSSPEIDPDTRDILVLLKHTGCRPMEVGGLSRSEIFIDAEIPFLKLQVTSGRSLKNNSAPRVIPLVLGGVDAAKRALARGQQGEYLFPESCRDTNKLSQRLKLAIREAGVPNSASLVPYSFRHSVIECLKTDGVSDEVRRDLMGHADRSAQANYGATSRPLVELAKGLTRGLSRLGEVEESQYRTGELPPK